MISPGAFHLLALNAPEKGIVIHARSSDTYTIFLMVRFIITGSKDL